MRDKKLSSIGNEVKVEARSIVDSLGEFADGIRCFLLLHRSKDGGSKNSESRRTFDFDVSNDKVQCCHILERMLLLHYVNDEPTRIYISVNRRSYPTAIRNLLTTMIGSFYDSEEVKDNLYKNLFRNTRTYLMQKNARVDNFFLIDVDRKEGEEDKDISAPALSWLGENNIHVHLVRQTKNGFHIITSPFNPNSFPKDIGEVKTDALLCIKY